MGVGASGAIISVMTNHDLILRAGGNSEKMRIKTNGNVGIGTTAPTQKLDVNGKIRMRNQTAGGDAADIVATKGYVDGKNVTVTHRFGGWVNLDGGSHDSTVSCQAGETVANCGCSFNHVPSWVGWGFSYQWPVGAPFPWILAWEDTVSGACHCQDEKYPPGIFGANRVRAAAKCMKIQ